MPKYDSSGLRAYVKMHAVNDAAADLALNGVEPFLSLKPQRPYPFARSGDIDVGGVARAMWIALEKPLHRCWFHSAASELPEPDRFDGQNGIVSAITKRYGQDIGNYAFNHNDDFREVVYEAVTERVRDAMAVSSGKRMDQRHVLSPERTVTVAVMYQIALSATGSPKAERLLPLTQLLLRTVPLGVDRSKPGSWCLVVL